MSDPLYTPEDYLEVSRCWSVLKRIHEGWLAGQYVFKPENELASNFRIRFPVGDQLPVMIGFEAQSARRVSARGGTRTFAMEYQLQIRVPEQASDLSKVRADEMLLVWIRKLIALLDGVNVPFYDFRIPASPVRMESLDFVIWCDGWARPSEKDDLSRNRATLLFAGEL
jgi:hypothetical protein